ncbi:MAG: hypothetical protein AAF674_12280 [Pseudomonadota bacterium]
MPKYKFLKKLQKKLKKMDLSDLPDLPMAPIAPVPLPVEDPETESVDSTTAPAAPVDPSLTGNNAAAPTLLLSESAPITSAPVPAPTEGETGVAGPDTFVFGGDYDTTTATAEDILPVDLPSGTASTPFEPILDSNGDEMPEFYLMVDGEMIVFESALEKAQYLLDQANQLPDDALELLI